MGSCDSRIHIVCTCTGIAKIVLLSEAVAIYSTLFLLCCHERSSVVDPEIGGGRSQENLHNNNLWHTSFYKTRVEANPMSRSATDIYKKKTLHTNTILYICINTTKPPAGMFSNYSKVLIISYDPIRLVIHHSLRRSKTSCNTDLTGGFESILFCTIKNLFQCKYRLP